MDNAGCDMVDIVEILPLGMTTPPIERLWHSEDDTAALAQRMAHQPALAHCTLALNGGLGAGKTTFTRHLLRALGAQGRIKSPTYALVEAYELDADWGPMNAWHFDFYRLEDPQEWEDAGLRELFASPGLKVVEWLDKAGALAPPVDLCMDLSIEPDSEQRRVRLSARSAVGARLLAGVLA
jgi:tRNA threonylcarbamoyladenosine biosynthesis protein TsaE